MALSSGIVGTQDGTAPGPAASSGGGPPTAQAKGKRGGPDGQSAGDVKVLFFASAREAAGCGSTVVACAGSTLGDLLAVLADGSRPELVPVMKTCAIWVNGLPAPAGTVLEAGDEVAVLPPVSGG